MTPEQAKLLESVFDSVVWYTPLRQDRETYPGFKDEKQILQLANQVLTRLKKLK